MGVRSIAVFCGSRNGANELFLQQAKALGDLLATNGIRLIYGGGNRGLMGAVANAVMLKGGEVIGVIPEMLAEKEVKHHGITELHVVADMHVRKKMMYELCDAAIILPGGNGTMDELFEMLTWNTLNIHNKKIFLLNIAGYYEHLIKFIESMTEQEFMYENWQERLIVCATPEEAINALV